MQYEKIKRIITYFTFNGISANDSSDKLSMIYQTCTRLKKISKRDVSWKVMLWKVRVI